MGDTRTKRQKLQAMAEQTASPEEAAVAKAMLADTPEGRLDAIARDIKAEWGKGIETEFAIGHLLIEARSVMPDNRDFGAWLKAQDFPFKYATARDYMRAAEREPEVRAFLDGYQELTGRDLRLSSAIQKLEGRAGNPSPSAEAVPVTDATPADPHYAALRAATYGILGYEVDEDGNGSFTKNEFLNMHVDDLTASAGYIKALAEAYNAAKAAR